MRSNEQTIQRVQSEVGLNQKEFVNDHLPIVIWWQACARHFTHSELDQNLTDQRFEAAKSQMTIDH